MSQTTTRRRKQILKAIESVLKDWGIQEYVNKENYIGNLLDDLVEAVDGIGKMPTDKKTEDKVKLIDDMINHVEKVIGSPGVINYGNRKWENAIKYLIKVQVEKGWDIQVLWVFLQSAPLMFEKDKLSYGSLMANPDKMLMEWMPRAHADKKETTNTTEAPQYDNSGRMI